MYVFSELFSPFSGGFEVSKTCCTSDLGIISSLLEIGNANSGTTDSLASLDSYLRGTELSLPDPSPSNLDISQSIC